jgi:hypothetical protein
MSGTVTSNVFRGSGVIAATPGGLDWSSAVITGSTLSAETGKGYFINTTSNTCTITLPASPAIGDQIVFADYARTWATNNVIIDSNGNNFQGDPDTYTVDYDTAGQSLNIVYSDATKGWLPVSDDAVADVGVAPLTQKGIFAFGNDGSGYVSVTNLCNSSGVIGNDVTGTGTARQGPGAGATYGEDKAIFAFGTLSGGAKTNIKNLVNNSGVMASDATGVGTARSDVSATSFGSSGEAVFAYGIAGPSLSMSNLVSSSGVVASDTTGVGTARNRLGACSYGGDKAIFGFGETASYNSMTNLVSSSGVIASDTTGVGTAKIMVYATGYGADLGIFAYGVIGAGNTNSRNLITNTGVCGSDQSGVGTARRSPAAMRFGNSGEAIFAYGNANVSNKISNTGVQASDVTGVGTSRDFLAGAGYSQSA